MIPYQSVRINGAVVQTGERSCDDRFDLIRPVLAQYKRPFTVLDLGANTGYFGQRIAEEYDAVSVCIDSDPVLIETLAKNGHHAVLGIQRHLSVRDLTDIAACEHFNVVLALNVLHHFDDWEGALGAVLSLGEHVIIETPPVDDVHACGRVRHAALYDAVRRAGSVILGVSPSHTTPGVDRELVLISRPKTRLTEPFLWSDLMEAKRMRPNTIISTATTQSWTMLDKDEHRPWFPGINLWTWAQLGGGYPSKDVVRGAVVAAYQQAVLSFGPEEHFVRVPHGDVRPWNFILHGTTATLIDWNDPRNLKADDGECIHETLGALDDPKKLWVYQTRKLNRWKD